MKHAWLAFSDAARWLHCLGAKNFTHGIPARETDEFSAEGTAAHSVRQACLRFGFDPYDLIGTTVGVEDFRFTVDQEMADHLMPGIDEIREFEGKLFVETQVDGTPWLGLDPKGNHQRGTLDAGVVGSHLTVLSDLKYGEGVAVQAPNNEQQMLYALSLWQQYGRYISTATDFLIIIDQPRNSAGGGYWHVTLKELQAFGESVKERAVLTRAADAPLTAGAKQCRWCPAANVPGRPGGCPAHHAWMADAIGLKFEQMDRDDRVGLDWQPPPYGALTPERKAHLVRVKKSIEQWLEKIHADVIADGLANRSTPGLKVVDGRRPKAKWREPGAAQAYLEQRLPLDKVFVKKLVSPAQATKILGKGVTLPVALVERGQPKPVLVSLEDARKSRKTIDEKFEDEDDEGL